MERMEFTGIRAREAAARPRLFTAFSAGFEGLERTSENRGVPGSSPGLAMRRSPACMRCVVVPGAVGWRVARRLKRRRSPFRTVRAVAMAGENASETEASSAKMDGLGFGREAEA